MKKRDSICRDHGFVDCEAFERLVRDHHRMLLAFALSLVSDRATAEDLVQEALVTASKKLYTFDSSRSFPAWIRGIIRFKYLEYRRAARRQFPLQPEVISALQDAHQRWEQAAQGQRHILDMLRTCLRKLPRLLGRTVDLFYIQECSGATVALELSCTEATVRKRLERGRRQLADCISQLLARESGTDYAKE